MKKEYIEPTLNTVRISCTQVLAVSGPTGGEYGDSGDAAESSRFRGGLFEDESTDDKWY